MYAGLWLGLLTLVSFGGSAAWAQSPQPAGNPAGVVTLAQGNASLAPAGGLPRTAKVGDVVHEGDVLTTPGEGELHLVMQDTGFMALRSNSQFMVLSYKADGGDEDKGVFKLLKGGLRSITGWIGRFNPSAYQVRTNSATIGIRGTDHETRYVPEGSSEGEAGTYDKVYAGQTYITTPEGDATEVAPNQAGFVSHKPRERPRVLAQMPGFFRPGPHEAEIAKKHAEIQSLIDQRRNERRKVISEKRMALVAARQHLKADFAQARATHQQEALALKARFLTLAAQREALQAEARSGEVGGAVLRQRRKALVAEYAALERTYAEFATRHKVLQDSAAPSADGTTAPAQDWRQSLRQDLQDVREKQQDLEAERASARKEIEALQRQENQRVRRERRADRETGPTSPPD